MAHHFHSHSVEQPAQTKGNLIRWAAYYDLAVNFTTLGHAARLRKITVDQALIKPDDAVLDVGPQPDCQVSCCAWFVPRRRTGTSYRWADRWSSSRDADGRARRKPLSNNATAPSRTSTRNKETKAKVKRARKSLGGRLTRVSQEKFWRMSFRLIYLA